ncbi:MAG: hypothetical protein AB1560_09265 [Pseudomonadota bacterium]
MYFFFSLIPATIGVIVGFFILFTSTRTQGAMQMFGRVLAIWVLILAASFPLAGAYATFAGFPSIETAMQSMHSRE